MTDKPTTSPVPAARRVSLKDKLAAANGNSQQAAAEARIAPQISEADIAKNPLYILLNAGDQLSNEELVEKLASALAFDPESDDEANIAKLADFDRLTAYYQNQMVALSKKLAAFSNDSAMSLYDEAVSTVQSRLLAFKSDINPLVRALHVMREAQAAGNDPQILIDTVKQLQADQADYEARLEQLKQEQEMRQKKIADETRVAKTYQERIELLSDRSRNRNTQLFSLSEAKAAYQSKLLGKTRFREEIEEIDRKMRGLQTDKLTEEVTLETTTRLLKQQAEELKALEEASVSAVATEKSVREALSKIVEELTQNGDYEAIAKLLEITGTEYKGKRENLVQNAEKFIEEAAKIFDQCIGRFLSLEGEVGEFAKFSANIMRIQKLVLAGSNKAYELSNETVKAAELKQAKLAEADKANGYVSSESEKVNNTVNNGKKHLNVLLPLRGTVVTFQSILAGRDSEFTALHGMVSGKRADAQELRTNGAVVVASQLVLTLKSLEASVAGRKTDELRGILKEFGVAAQGATTHILDTLAQDAAARNSRFTDAIQKLVDMQQQLAIFSDVLLDEAQEGATLTDAILEATKGVVNATGDLQNVVVEGARLAREDMGSDAGKEIVELMRQQTPAPAVR